MEFLVSKDLYVGNLQWATTEEEIKELFSQHGEVESVKIIMDRETNKSKGFAFVNMENADEAISALNGAELRGRSLRVNPARDRKKPRAYA